MGLVSASEKNRSIRNSENHKNSKSTPSELSVHLVLKIFTSEHEPDYLHFRATSAGQTENQTQVSLRSDHLGNQLLRWPPSPHIPASVQFSPTLVQGCLCDH